MWQTGRQGSLLIGEDWYRLMDDDKSFHAFFRVWKKKKKKEKKEKEKKEKKEKSDLLMVQKRSLCPHTS